MGEELINYTANTVSLVLWLSICKEISVYDSMKVWYVADMNNSFQLQYTLSYCITSSRCHFFVVLPRQARVMAARWIECIEFGCLLRARTNWKLRIPPIRPHMQHAEKRIIWKKTQIDIHSEMFMIVKIAKLIFHQQNSKQNDKNVMSQERHKMPQSFHHYYIAVLDNDSGDESAYE